MSLRKTFYHWLGIRSSRKDRQRKPGISAEIQLLESRMLLSGTPVFADPHREAGNQFGASVTVLSNGNVVITAPYDDAGGGSAYSGTGAGAVYLFNGQTGALIYSIKGSHAGDTIGSPIGTQGGDTAGSAGVIALTNGNFVISSPQWNGDRGAVTWCNGTTGVNQVVGSQNSLIGSAAGDQVGEAYYYPYYGTGSNVTALSNGNYVVCSPNWNSSRGAVTFGNGSTGVTGVVGATNSLIGSTADDFVGKRGITVLTNGNYVVRNPEWDNGSLVNAGAATFGSGTTGIKGAISAVNSLIGTHTSDLVGSGGITALSNGNFVVDSSNWQNGATTSAGAVTWGNGTTGLHGLVAASNSLVGSNANDQVGAFGVTALTNGNYVVESELWNNNIGAVTWCPGTGATAGIVSTANSLVGSTSGDNVGGGGVTVLSNGNYVVDSAAWNYSTGAVTWCNGLVRTVGTVSAINSLVGNQAGDQVGGGDIGGNSVVPLTNGNYVVISPSCSNYGATSAGAVTWGGGTQGVKGAVTSSNSLLGTQTNDKVGYGGVTALVNGNYVVSSPNWANGGIANAGAATWGNGTKGIVGNITSGNSLIGSTANDGVGGEAANPGGGAPDFGNGVTALTNGNYVVASPDWSNGSNAHAGAATWGNGTSGVTGIITQNNSLIGDMANDAVGRKRYHTGVVALSNGNYVVASSGWLDSYNNTIGAVTWGSGTTGVKGIVGQSNSLVGTPTYRQLGDDGITPLPNGNYIVSSVGSMTFGDGNAAVQGDVTNSNSVFANPVNLAAGPATVASDAANGRFYVAFPIDTSDVVYRGSTASGFAIVTNSTPTIAVAGPSQLLTNGTGSLNLGTTTPGTPATLTITVTNSGGAPLVVQPVTFPAGYSVLNNFAANQSIASGASASFTLQLNATAIGTPSGVVTIRSNDPSAGTFTFNVAGTVAAPKIVVKQGATVITNGIGTVNLGNAVLGTPVSQVITITNSGNVPLLLASATLPAGFSIVAGINFTTGQILATGASATFTLRLNATAIGTPGGLITISTNDPTASPFTFNVTGAVAAPKISVSIPGLKLLNPAASGGLTTVVGTPVTRVITVYNTGTANLVLQPLTTANLPSGFSIPAGMNLTTQPILPGSSASFTLQLDGAAVGRVGGLVTIANNDPTSNPFSFPVTGIVTASATAAVLQVQWNSTTLQNGTGKVYFNETAQGAADTETITITNQGASSLQVSSLALTTGFSLVQPFTGPQTIAAHGSLNIAIQLSAGATTRRTPTGTLTINNSDVTNSSFQLQLIANLAPTAITINPNTVSQNQTNDVVLGRLTTTDPDSATVPQTFTYTITDANAKSLFTIDGQGYLIVAAGTALGVNTINVTATDQAGLSKTVPLSFAIMSAGTSASVGSDKDVTSGTPKNFAIASFSTSGIRVQSNGQNVANVIHYQLDTGGDNGNFVITDSGQLQTAINLNATTKKSYTITIITTDVSTGISTRHPYTVNVVPQIRSAVIVQPATFGAADASPNGSVVGTVSATATSGNRLTYSITGGNTGNAFAINPATGQITVANSTAVTLAGNPTFSLRVQATDNRVSGSAIITINVAKIVLSNSTIGSNATLGTIVGQFTTTESGTGNTFTYSLPAGVNDNNSFALDTSNHLKLSTAVNIAVKSSYQVYVVSTDQHGVSTGATFLITVVGPSNLTLSGSSIAVNAAVGTPIGQLVTTETGTGNTFTYSLPVGTNDNAFFTVDATGLLKVKAQLTQPIKTSYTVDIVSTDQRSLTIEKRFTLTVLGPTKIAISNSSFVATAAAGTVVGQFSTTAAGTGNTFTYTLPAGVNDDDNFIIDATNHLVLNVALPTPVRSSYLVNVVSTDQNGLSLTQAFTISVAGPSNLTLSNNVVAMNAAVGTTIGQFVTTDTGTGNTFVYTLSAGVSDNASFTVDATGHLILNTHINYATKDTYTISVVSKDQHGLSLGAVFSVYVLGPPNINDAPVGTPKTVTALEDIPYAFGVADFGFTDPHDSPANSLLAVKIKTLPLSSRGTLMDNGAAITQGATIPVADIQQGKLKFVVLAPNAKGAQFASFLFQVQDNGGTANGGLDSDKVYKTMTINVTPVNDPPTGASKTVTTLEDTPYVLKGGDFTLVDPIDLPANVLQAIKIDSLPLKGQLTISGIPVTVGATISSIDIAQGRLIFTPVANANGPAYASFNFQVQDNGGTANGGIDTDPVIRNFTINVTSVNDAPAGRPATVTTLEDVAYVFKAADFGYSDPIDNPANTLSNVKITTVPSRGSLFDGGATLVAGAVVPAADIAAGKFKFLGLPDGYATPYIGFTFQVEDNGGTANSGRDTDPTPRTMTINVTGVNDPPVGTSKTITMAKNTTYVFKYTDFGYSDPHDPATNPMLAVKITTIPTAGSLTDNGVSVVAGTFISVADISAGKLKFTPASNATGTAYGRFTFQVQDNGGTANGGLNTDLTPRLMTISVS